MTPDQAFPVWLATFPEWVAIVGTRVYPDVAPQGAAMPYAVLTEVSARTRRRLNGTPEIPRSIDSNWQLDVYATTKRSAKTACRIVHERISHFRGLAGGLPVAILAGDRRDSVEQSDDAAGVVVYRSSLDFEVMYQEV